MNDVRLNIRISKEERDKLNEKCKSLGCTYSTLIKSYIDNMIYQSPVYRINAVDISTWLMEMYQIVNGIDTEEREILLKKLGEIECHL